MTLHGTLRDSASLTPALLRSHDSASLTSALLRSHFPVRFYSQDPSLSEISYSRLAVTAHPQSKVRESKDVISSVNPIPSVQPRAGHIVGVQLHTG